MVWTVVKCMPLNKHRIILTFQIKSETNLKIPRVGKELTKTFSFSEIESDLLLIFQVSSSGNFKICVDHVMRHHCLFKQ